MAFLVYVAAILRHEPIFAQSLRFIFGAAGAVEQLAMQGAVSIANFRHTVFILKLCVAFLTGHQIKLLHSASSFPFCVSGKQRSHSTTNFRAAPLTLAPKSSLNFRRECVLTRHKAFGKNAQPASRGCRSQRVWEFPTSILQRKIGVCIDRRTACGNYASFQSAT